SPPQFRQLRLCLNFDSSAPDPSILTALFGAEENRGRGDVEEDDGVSEAGPADGIGAFFREVNYDSSFAAGSGGGSWGGPQLQPLFLAQSSSSRSLGHEIKLLHASLLSACGRHAQIRRRVGAQTMAVLT
ncbi:unnamed protein product, partial [Brassica rapa subsp. narinosa]